MDQIFDRLGNLLRSLFQEEEPRPAGGRRPSVDPDLETAWEELDEFLKTGKTQGRSQRSSGAGYTGASHGTTGAVPEEIKRDYANLEVPIGADMATVQKSYRRLIRQYHPDRFAGNAQKFKDATEITQKINQSYQRIKKYRSTGKI